MLALISSGHCNWKTVGMHADSLPKMMPLAPSPNVLTMLTVLLINYSGLTRYSIEKNGGVNHASKKDIVRGRHSFVFLI
jgi:hypothetical protein